MIQLFNPDKIEKFQIRIEKCLIQDSERNNIFQIKSYYSPEQFSCHICLNSMKIITQLNNITESETKIETEKEPETEKELAKKGSYLRFWRTNSWIS